MEQVCTITKLKNFINLQGEIHIYIKKNFAQYLQFFNETIERIRLTPSQFHSGPIMPAISESEDADILRSPEQCSTYQI